MCRRRPPSQAQDQAFEASYEKNKWVSAQVAITHYQYGISTACARKVPHPLLATTILSAADAKVSARGQSGPQSCAEYRTL